MHSLIYRVDQSGYEQHLLERQLHLCRQRLIISNFSQTEEQETEDQEDQPYLQEEVTGP